MTDSDDTKPRRAFWMDDQEDEKGADPGTDSRFGNYITLENQASLRECISDLDDDLDPVRFVCEMWRIGTSPVMTGPPYIYFDKAILSARLERSDWDGGLLAVVDLISPLPNELRRTRDWTGGRYWGDYREEFGRYVGPTEEDLSRSPALLPSLQLLHQWDETALRSPDLDEIAKHGYTGEAKKSLREIVRLLNAVVDPVIRALGV